LGGGLGERELDGEAEGEGEGEGEGGLFIVIAGAGVAGTCFSVPISFSVPFSCTCSWSFSCASSIDMPAVLSSRVFSSLSISVIVSLYKIRVQRTRYTETIDDAQTPGPFPARHHFTTQRSLIDLFSSNVVSQPRVS
jgi:hypothetical protein